MPLAGEAEVCDLEHRVCEVVVLDGLQNQDCGVGRKVVTPDLVCCTLQVPALPQLEPCLLPPTSRCQYNPCPRLPGGPLPSDSNLDPGELSERSRAKALVFLGPSLEFLTSPEVALSLIHI